MSLERREGRGGDWVGNPDGRTIEPQAIAHALDYAPEGRNVLALVKHFTRAVGLARGKGLHLGESVVFESTPDQSLDTETGDHRGRRSESIGAARQPAAMLNPVRAPQFRDAYLATA